MNLKFFLTISLSFGCVVMLFLWYSANNIHKESQLYAKQFLFKISTLESENKMETKLLNSLRVDITKNDEELRIKTNLLDTMHNKEKSRDEEREKLQRNIEAVKERYEAVNKENNIWLENWKVESQNKSESDTKKIKELEDELQSLKAEYNKLKKQVKPTTTINDKTIKDNKVESSVKKNSIEMKANTTSVKVKEPLDSNKTEEDKLKQPEKENQLRQARPPFHKDERPSEHNKEIVDNKADRNENKNVSKKEAAEKDPTKDLSPDNKSQEKNEQGKISNIKEEKNDMDGQLKKPKVMLQPKSFVEGNDAIKKFLDRKRNNQSNDVVERPKAEKRLVDHQVKPPIPIKNKDKSAGAKDDSHRNNNQRMEHKVIQGNYK